MKFKLDELVSCILRSIVLNCLRFHQAIATLQHIKYQLPLALNFLKKSLPSKILVLPICYCEYEGWWYFTCIIFSNTLFFLLWHSLLGIESYLSWDSLPVQEISANLYFMCPIVLTLKHQGSFLESQCTLQADFLQLLTSVFFFFS